MTTMTNRTYYEQLDTLDPVVEKLYNNLKSFKDNKTHKCHPSIKTLEVGIKRCRQTTKKYLSLLADIGFIHIRERKVKHKVTNNKFNETNEYTLLLETCRGTTKKISPNNKKESEPLILKETDLEKTVRELQNGYSKESISSALKAMRKNIRSGSIINNMKNYLVTLITKSSSQLNQVNKAIESSNKALNSTSASKDMKHKSPRPNTNKVNTKFHNFEQRTGKYDADQLEKIVLNNHKKKRE